MVKFVSVSEAKAEFSSLVEDVIRGEEVIITKHGTPVVKMIRYTKPKLVFGLLEDKYPELADVDFDDNSDMEESWAKWRSNLDELGK